MRQQPVRADGKQASRGGGQHAKHAILRQHDPPHLAAGGAERSQQHILAHPLETPGQHSAGKHDHARHRDEHRHEPDHERHLVENAIQRLQHEAEVDGGHVGKGAHNRLLHRCGVVRGTHARGDDEEFRSRLEHAFGKNNKEIGLQPLPFHGPQTAHARPDRHPLHVKRDFVSNPHLQLLRQPFLDGNRHNPGPRGDPPHERPGNQFFRVGEPSAIGAPILAAQGPSGVAGRAFA